MKRLTRFLRISYAAMRRRGSVSRKTAMLLICIVVFPAVALVAVLMSGADGEGQSSNTGIPLPPVPPVLEDESSPSITAESIRLLNSNAALQNKLNALRPAGTYVVVDTAANRLYLYRKSTLVRTAVISSGSGNVLEEPDGERRWVFDTPRGEYAVNSKLRNPDWVKPDWAFIEENEDIPARQQDRVVSGVLGDYALGFGNGYFIHGTLYTRLLGRNITHGCVRAANEDLKVIFNNAPLGTKIYIF